jgi:hypothetical protein
LLDLAGFALRALNGTGYARRNRQRLRTVAAVRSEWKYVRHHRMLLVSESD